MTTSILYPRESVCGSCGTSMLLTWHNPLDLSQGGDPVYRHPRNGCEFAGKMLKPAGMFAGEVEGRRMTRDVPIDEVFTWKDDFHSKAQEAFGSHTVDVSPKTYSDLRLRCDKLEREIDPFFDHIRGLQSEPFNGIDIHMVRQGTIPDGILRACACRKKDPTP